MNDENISKARTDIDNYKKRSEDKLKDYEKQMKDYIADMQRGVSSEQPPIPKLDKAPEVPEAKKMPGDLSNYINFLHPWGNIVLDPFVLLVMFFGLVIGTVIVLRAQDIL